MWTKMKSKVLKALLTVCLSIWSLGGWANSLHFLSMEDGLSGISVNKILKDHQGLVWIAASDGINTFNGNRISSFDISVCGKPHNTVSDLCEVGGRRIYAVTRDGIIMMEKGNSHFKPVLQEVSRPQCLFADGNLLYIGCMDGLLVYDGKKTKRIPMNSSPEELSNSIRKIVKASDGRIYFFSRYAIHWYNPKTGKHAEINISNHLPQKTTFGQFAVQGNRIYVGTKNNGMFCYDQKTRQVSHIDEIGNIITSVYNCGNGQICVGTDGSGAYVLDARTNKVVEHYGVNEDERYHIPTNAVYEFMRDEHGVDWFGFSRYGMAYTYHNASLFSPFAYGDFTTQGLDVRSFCVNGTEVLVGTYSGFVYVDRKHGIVKRIEPQMLGGTHIVTRIVSWRGLYYIGTYDGGLKVFNPSTTTVTAQHFDELLNSSNIADMQVSPDGKLWIGCSDGLFVVDKEGKVSHFTEQNSRIIGGTINSITFDNHQKVWLSSKDGMSAFVLSANGLVPVKFPDGFFNQELRLKGISGHGGSIYFYNMNGGYYTDANIQKYGMLPLMDKMPDEKCIDFLDDGKGYYWVATERGLFGQDYDFRQLMHFGYGEGIMGGIINDIALDDKGKLWIASSDGLLSMDASAVARWHKNTAYKVLAYDLTIDGKPMPMASEYMVNDSKSIHLSWNMESEELCLTPILSDYAKPYGRIYEYRLDDAEEWKVVAAGKKVKLSHLMLGSHRLSIRLAGAFGTEETYHILVLPSVACVLEILFLIAAFVLLYLWNRYRKNTNALISERNEIEGALIELEQTAQQQEAQQEVEQQEAQQEVLPEKYQRMRLDDAECADIVNRMRKIVEKDKLYLHPDLKRTEIAEAIGVTPAKLSQVFSLYLKENYYDFVNRYRLEEFKRLVKDDAYKRYTILALSEKCGFKKTSFFSTFRKVEGMTPTEYLKTQNIKMKM